MREEKSGLSVKDYWWKLLFLYVHFFNISPPNHTVDNPLFPSPSLTRKLPQAQAILHQFQVPIFLSSKLVPLLFLGINLTTVFPFYSSDPKLPRGWVQATTCAHCFNQVFFTVKLSPSKQPRIHVKHGGADKAP